MKINIICKKPKRENKYIKPFAEFYVSSYFPKIKEIEIDCPDKNNQTKQPDYFLIQPKILIEIKEVHERKELETSIAWIKNIDRLEKELDSRDLSNIHGSYLVYTPKMIRVKNRDVSRIVDEILEAILKNQLEVEIKEVGKFKVDRYFEKGNAVSFSPTPEARWINAPETINRNIKNKIKTANNQLGSFKNNRVNKNILLLIKKYLYGAKISDFIEALTYSYNNLLKYKNIDEMWLQLETRDGKFLHTLIYTRNFITSFDEKSIKVDSQTIDVFEKWFYPLTKLEDKYKKKLFIALKRLLKNKKPHQLFPNRFTREVMVRLGIWLAKEEKFNDVIWIIDKFINDPSPGEPEKYKGDPRFNYHKRIVKGEDPNIITTVLGHLAWVIQRLALQKKKKNKKYVIKSLAYTKNLLKNHKNLYVKKQAIVPLTEIAVRRQLLDGYGKRPYQGTYKEFNKLVFDLVKLVKKNPEYKAIAKWLSHIFAYYKDLSTQEVKQVLDSLKVSDESAPLFVYFGIFRQRHYRDQPIKFNGGELDKKLKEMIKSGNKNYWRLRASIAWHFWKILEKNRNEFNTLKPYIDLFLEQPYQRDIYDDIERIISDWIKDKPEICIQWYKSMLSQISKFLAKKKHIHPWEGLWLMSTEEVVEAIVRHNPDEVLEIMEKLVSAWKKLAFIGNPKRLFESYKLISDNEQKLKIKKKFQEWHRSMKKLNPRLEKIDWD